MAMVLICFFMKYKDKDISNCSSNCIDEYNGYSMAPYTNFGISLGFSRFRISPSIAIAYAYIYDEMYDGEFEILLVPEINFCYILN